MAGRRCAEWRFPTQKQQRKEEMERKLRGPDQVPSRGDDGWWDAVRSDPRAAGRPGIPIQARRLSEIPREVLCVECLRCFAPSRSGFWTPLGSTVRMRSGRRSATGCWSTAASIAPVGMRRMGAGLTSDRRLLSPAERHEGHLRHLYRAGRDAEKNLHVPDR
jgi:hypothetical protein